MSCSVTLRIRQHGLLKKEQSAENIHGIGNQVKVSLLSIVGAK